jgi:hypothetical protein
MSFFFLLFGLLIVVLCSPGNLGKFGGVALWGSENATKQMQCADMLIEILILNVQFVTFCFFCLYLLFKLLIKLNTNLHARELVEVLKFFKTAFAPPLWKNAQLSS